MPLKPARVLINFALVSLLVTLFGCMGYVPGRQSYWDTRIKELCQKDGGVTVYEQVELTVSEYRLLRGAGAAVVIPSRQSAGSDAAYVRETVELIIRESNPKVVRRETRVIRTADQKILSRWVTYSRIGGDIPSPAHPSSFGCRDVGIRGDIEQQTFVIPEGKQ